MIKVREFVQLIGRKEPKIEKRGWEYGVDFTGCEADERSKREGHLINLRGEGWVARAACGLHDDVVGAS